jgi:hypothetical protein
MKARLQKLKAEIQLEVAAEIQRVIERRFSDVLDVVVRLDGPQLADPQPAETLLPKRGVTVTDDSKADGSTGDLETIT